MENNTIKAVIDQIITQEEVKNLTAEIVELFFKPEIKPDALYTIVQAARLLDVSAQTLRNAIHKGHLKLLHIGANPRIRGAAINEWLDAGGKTGRSRATLAAEKKRSKAA
jgi:excisionase family DNA binding protein